MFNLLFILHVAYFGIAFFTECRDARLYSRMEGPLGTRGILLPRPLRLLVLKRTVAVGDTLRGATIQTKHAHEPLDRIAKVDKQCTLGFLW